MIKISLFYCCERVFIYINIWIIGKNPIKHHYLRKSLNVDDITDANYTHEKTVFKDFVIKHLGEYRDFYVQKQYIIVS